MEWKLRATLGAKMNKGKSPPVANNGLDVGSPMKALSTILIALVGVACFSCSPVEEDNGRDIPNNLHPANGQLGARNWPSSFRFVQLLDQNLWIVSDETRVWRTEDGGNSWTQCYMTRPGSGYGLSIRGLSFVDRETGFMIDRSTLLRTSDAGLTWAQVGEVKSPDQSCLLENCYFAQSCCFLDPLNGWVVGSANNSDYLLKPTIPPYVGLLLRTQDGGRTWERKIIKAPHGHINKGNRWALNDLFFSDRLYGWVVGDGVIFATTDGGETWKMSEINGRNQDAVFEKVLFVDRIHGWVTMKDQDKLLYTNDGGSRWSSLNGPATMLGLQTFHITFVTPEHGFAILRRLYETTDSGFHWKELAQATCDKDRDFGYLGRACDSSLITFCFSSGMPRFLVSTDNGKTWEPTSRRSESVTYPLIRF